MATPIGVPAKHTTITTSAQIRAVGQDEGRKVRFLASTSQKDRHGTIVSPTGIQTDSFLKNPVFLWSHKSGGPLQSCDPEDVIGRVTSLSVSDAGLEIEVEFAAVELNPKADRCLSLVKAGFLNAVSIGFIPVESHSDGDAIIHDKIELLEISLVVVGSNSDALALRQLISISKRSALMTRAEACKKLGVDEDASAEDRKRALREYQDSTDDDAATRKAVREASDEDEDEDKKKDEDDEGTRAAIAALTSELQAAKAEIAQVAEQRQAAEKDAEQTKWVDKVIAEGRWSPAKRAELLDLAKKGIAESTVRHIPAGTFTRQARIFEGGNPVSAAPAQVQTAALTEADKRVLKVFEQAGMKVDHTRYLSDKARFESKGMN